VRIAIVSHAFNAPGRIHRLPHLGRRDPVLLVGPAHRHGGTLTAPDDRLPAADNVDVAALRSLSIPRSQLVLFGAAPHWHRSGRTSSASTTARGAFSSGSWFEFVEDLIRNPIILVAKKNTSGARTPCSAG
jgi:hypothetical protein